MIILTCNNFRDKNSTSNMKIDTLAFLNCLLSNHSPVVFHSHIKVIVPVSNFALKLLDPLPLSQTFHSLLEEVFQNHRWEARKSILSSIKFIT